MDTHDISTEVTTEIRGIQNGLEEIVTEKIENGDDSVITTFDSIENMHNDDSDIEEHVTVTKTITYTQNTTDISGTRDLQPEVHITSSESNEQHVTDLNNSSLEDNNTSYFNETIESNASELDDSVVEEFFSGSADEEDISEQRLTMRTDAVARPYGGGLAVAINPLTNHTDPTEDSDGGGDSGGYVPPEPVHSIVTNDDVLITSENRGIEDNDSDNEFEVPDLPPPPQCVTENPEPVQVTETPEQEQASEPKDTVMDKIQEVRDQGLEYAAETANDKISEMSDDGLIGKAKSQILEHNVVDTGKEKLEQVSSSLIQSGLSKGTENGKDQDSTEDNKDDSEKVLDADSGAPILEIDTANALADDDMDYEMKEVDISQGHDEDFGKVFANNRQSMRESNSGPLFHQDASRFSNNNTDSLKKEKKGTKEKNGSSYTINSMPADEERPQKGCASILRNFFCPKRGSWQPDSYF